MTVEEITVERKKIDALTQLEACRIWRFARAGHLWFQSDGPLWPFFEAKFKALGGFTPAISREIGLGKIGI